MSIELMMTIEVMLLTKVFIKIRWLTRPSSAYLPQLKNTHAYLTKHPESQAIFQRSQAWKTITPLVMQLSVLLPSIWLFWFNKFTYAGAVLTLQVLGGLLMTFCLFKTSVYTKQLRPLNAFQPLANPQHRRLSIIEQALGIGATYLWLSSLIYYTITAF